MKNTTGNGKAKQTRKVKICEETCFSKFNARHQPQIQKNSKTKKRGLNQREMLSSCVLWPTNRSKGKIEKTEDPSPEKEQGQRQRRSFFRVCDKKTED